MSSSSLVLLPLRLMRCAPLYHHGLVLLFPRLMSCAPQYHNGFGPLVPQADEYVVYNHHQQQTQYLVEFTLPVDSEEEKQEGEEEEEGVGEAGVGSEGEEDMEEKDEGRSRRMWMREGDWISTFFHVHTFIKSLLECSVEGSTLSLQTAWLQGKCGTHN